MKEILVKNTVPTKHSEGYYLICFFFGILMISLGIFHIKIISLQFQKFSQIEFFFFKLCVYPVMSVYLMKLKKVKFSQCLDDYKLNISILIRHIFSFLHNNCRIMVLQYFRLSTCSIFTSISPIFICILSVIFLKEKFTRREFFGFIICFTGAYLLIQNEEDSPLYIAPNENKLLHVLIGCIFGFGHAFFVGCMVVSTKMLLNTGFEIELLLFFIGNLGMIFGILTKIFSGFDITENIYNVNFVLNAFLNGFFSYFADYLLNYAQKNIPLIKSSTIAYSDLVLSFLLGYFFLNENITSLDLLGSILIIGFNFFNILFPKK